MRSASAVWAIPCVALLGSGCASNLDTTHGKAVFGALQRAVEDVEARTAPSVVYVRLKETARPEGAPGRELSFSSRTRASDNTQGVILTAKGHILIPQVAKPEAVGRLEVLVGDTEYSARILMVDDNLKMTVIKIEPDEDLVPLDMENSVDLDTGAWCVISVASDEESEYETYTVLSLCAGQVDGRYRQFVLNTMPGNASGAPVVSMDGRIAGIIQNRSVLAMSDLRVDLKELLADADDVDQTENDEDNAGWFGVSMEPVNREYAKAHGLPTSGLWVVNVVGGSPASACGLREGDLIVGFDGKPLRLSGARARDYLVKTMRAKPGKPFSVSVIRDGKTHALSGAFARKPPEESLRAEDIGVTVKAITDAERFGNNLFTRDGVLVTDIRTGSPAATSSSFGRPLLSTNDVIVELAGRPTRTLDEFSRALEYIRREKLEIVQVAYWRGRVTGYAGLKLQKNDNEKGGA